MPIETGTFTHAGIALHYACQRGAPGAPILFIHGITGRWQTWLPTMLAFADDHPVYALDLRGHGRSGRAADYRAVDYARDVVAFIREAIGGPTVLIGHSLGAIVGIAVAADRGAPVARLVLEDPPLGVFSDQSMRDRHERERFTVWRDLIAAQPTTEVLWREVARSMPDAPLDAVGQRAETLRQVDPAVLTTVLEDRGKDGYDLDDLLRTIACPTLLLQGNIEIGGALEPPRAEHARSLLRDCTSVYLPEVGHGIHNDEPFRFCDLVRRFL